MLDTLLNTIIQAGAVLVLCLIVWAIWGRRSSRFAAYFGLIGARPWLVLAMTAAGAALAFALVQLPAARSLASGEGSVAAGAAGHGLALVVNLILLAVFKTAFAEELLFRGLIGKRAIAAFGFQVGNLIQALLFGALHLLVLLIPQASMATALGMVVFTGVSGWICGWVNERPGRGSILPGWGAHAGANLAAYLLIGLG